ncbi:MAG: choice-of-anchor D domain-containing protein [Caldithrix sp.]|nr:choice-of-anchor D domain-containing protein [Caldithrix sp.]
MKTYRLFIILIIACSVHVYAQNNEDSTRVQGTLSNAHWTLQDSPYRVMGDIIVDRLIIDGGVVVEFADDYNFEVTGLLLARGTKTDTIRFSNAEDNPSGGWQGIYFNSASDNCEFNFVHQQGSAAHGVRLYNTFLTIENSHITKNAANGIHVDYSQLTLNRVVIDSSADNGLYLTNEGSITLNNTKVVNNEQNGIDVNLGQIALNNSIVANNGQTGMFFSDDNSGLVLNAVNSNIINNNSTGIFAPTSQIELINCILYDNTNQIGAQSATAEYCNIQGGYAGQGNIAQPPLFVDEQNFNLSANSPCIDAGNPDSLYNDQCFPPSLGAMRNDIGAYGGPHACNWLEPLYIIPSELDFDTVVKDSSKNLPLKIKNYRSQQQSISNIYAEDYDGNDNAQYYNVDITSVTLQPYDSVQVQVTFNPLITGNLPAKLAVISNLDEQRIELQGKGVKSDILVGEDSLVFKEVRPLEAKSDNVQIYNLGSDTLKAFDIYTSTTYFTNNRTAMNIPPFGTDSVKITFTPDSLGHFTDTLHIINSDPDISDKHQRIPLTGYGKAPLIAVDTNPVNFKKVWVKSDSSIDVILSNNGTIDLTIHEITIEDNFSEAYHWTERPLPITVPHAGNDTIRMHFLPSDTGMYTAQLNVLSDAFQMDTLAINLTGRGVSPIADLIPNMVQFDKVRVDSIAQGMVSIQNKGDTTLTVRDIQINGTDSSAFKYMGPALPVNVDHMEDTLVFHIQFKPQVSDRHEAYVQIFTDDSLAKQNPHQITLQGLGQAPRLLTSLDTLIFGDVQTFSDSSATVTLRNAGNLPLKVDSIVINQHSKNPFQWTGLSTPAVIDTNDEERQITIQYQPTFMGRDSATLMIYSDDPRDPKQPLVLKARSIRSRAEFSLNTIQCGLHPVNKDTTVYFSIHNSGNQNLIIDTLSITGEDSMHFGLEPSHSPLSIDPDSDMVFTLKFTPSDSGDLSASLVFSSNDPELPDRIIPVSARARPSRLATSHDYIAFPNVDVEDKVMETLILTNTSDVYALIDTFYIVSQEYNAFSIDNMPSFPQRLQKNGDSLAIQINFNPADPGFKQSQLVINSSDYDESVKNIDLQGRALAVNRPFIQTYPADSLKFGQVYVTNTIHDTLTIYNYGDQQLRIDSLQIDGNAPDVFSVDQLDLPQNLEARGTNSLRIRIQFSPQKIGYNQSQIKLYSNDTSRSPLSTTLSGEAIIDPTPADISIDAQGLELNAGNPYELNADINDPDVQITAVSLFIRRGGMVSYDSLVFDPAEQNQWRIDIPGSYFSEQGVQFFVRVKHGGRFTFWPSDGPSNPFSVPVNIDQLSFPAYSKAREYQMISLPVLSGQQNLADLFSDELGPYNPEKYRMFDWNVINEEFIELNDMQATLPPGKAYWFISRDSVRLQVEEIKSLSISDGYDIQLHEGWNMIASPYPFTVGWLSSPSWDKLYHYKGTGWEESLVMKPFQGYALYARSDTTIHISAQNVDEEAHHLSKGSGTDPMSDYPWYVRVMAEKGHYADRYNFASVHTEASSGRDHHDIIDPPNIGRHVALYFKHSSDSQDGLKYAYDIHSDQNEGWRFDFTVESNFEGKTTIRINPMELPEAYECLIICPATGVRYNKLPIETGLKKQVYSLLIGDRTFIQNMKQRFKAIPNSFRLQQNYPNPFNQSTSIQYQMPRSGSVTMKVYDILGRKVRTLLNNKELDAGYYHVRWDGKNDGGKNVSSGLYFVTIKSQLGYKAIKTVLNR